MRFTPPETRFISLPVILQRRVVVGVGLWCMLVWGLAFVVLGIIEPFVTGASWWKLPVCLLVWPAFPWLAARFTRLDTVLIGPKSLRRVGILRERAVPWSEVKGVRRITRRVRHRDVPLLSVQTAGRELILADLSVDDDNAVLEWALAAATSGRAHEIEERVRVEGQPAGRARWYVVHVIVAVTLSAALGYTLFKSETRRRVDRTLDGASLLPLAQRIASHEPLFADTSLRVADRCRAGTTLQYARVDVGDAAGAYDVCSRQLQLSCPYASADRCADFAALRDARAALNAGQPERALALLEGSPFQGPTRGGIEVPALVALGRMDAAAEASARCLGARYAQDPANAGLVARCRLSP